jgi:flagellar biosynthesis protein FlhF
MQLESFRGNELHKVIKQVRLALGDDAMIVHTHVTRGSQGNVVEVIAAHSDSVEAFKDRLDGAKAAAERAKTRKRVGPYLVALVGPGGAGKTAALMKVALNPRGVAHKKVGLLTLDTYRVGALEEIQTYAEISDIPLEAAYTPEDARQALQRLRGRDVVLVDTPGRGFGGGTTRWVEILEELDPDEIHLVIPAGFRPEVAKALIRTLPGVRPTHVLFSKLDEVPLGMGLVDLAEAVDLPVRWVSESPDIPNGLAPAGPRILASLGVGSGLPVPTRRHAG